MRTSSLKVRYVERRGYLTLVLEGAGLGRTYFRRLIGSWPVFRNIETTTWPNFLSKCVQFFLAFCWNPKLQPFQFESSVIFQIWGITHQFVKHATGKLSKMLWENRGGSRKYTILTPAPSVALLVGLEHKSWIWKISGTIKLMGKKLVFAPKGTKCSF